MTLKFVGFLSPYLGYLSALVPESSAAATQPRAPHCPGVSGGEWGVGGGKFGNPGAGRRDTPRGGTHAGTPRGGEHFGGRGDAARGQRRTAAFPAGAQSGDTRGAAAGPGGHAGGYEVRARRGAGCHWPCRADVTAGVAISSAAPNGLGTVGRVSRRGTGLDG